MSLVGLALYLLPGILILTCLYLYLPILLFESAKPLSSFKLSFERVKPHFLLVAALVILAMLVNSIPMMVHYVVGYFNVVPNDGQGFGIQESINVVLSGFTIPFINALVLTTYFHLKQYYATTEPH